MLQSSFKSSDNVVILMRDVIGEPGIRSRRNKKKTKRYRSLHWRRGSSGSPKRHSYHKRVNKTKQRMVTVLLAFPELDVSETSTQAARWKKWISRFRNLLVAMNVTDQTRQRALLLHYAGEATNDIFDTLPNTAADEGEDLFDNAVQALTNYFTPKQNREYEIYVFRQAKQEHHESISAFHTRLRQLAVNCEFDDVDREIKTQIVQTCSPRKSLVHSCTGARCR